MTIYHIVAGLSGAGVMKYAIRKDTSEWYGEVIGILDDFSVGPLCYLGRDVYDQRQMWLMNMIKMTGDLEDWEEFQELYRDVIKKLDAINKEDKIVVWYGPSSMDLICLYQICHRFRENHVFKVSLSELGEHKYMHVPAIGVCDPEQILTLIKKIKLVVDEEKAWCVKELERLINENKMVRILEDDRILSKEEEFYDEVILSSATKTYLKAARVIGKTMGKSKYPVGDTFIDYRLRKLIEKGELILKGDIESTRRFIEVKLP